MNFNSVKETVERARSVAKKLSLNEMAKQDEYIHSDGLNISNKMKKKKSILEEVDASNALFLSNDAHKHPHGHSGTGTTSLGNSNGNERPAFTSQNMSKNHNNYNDDDDDDSVDSFDPENDPLLQMAKTRRTYSQQKQQHQQRFSLSVETQMNMQGNDNGNGSRSHSKSKTSPVNNDSFAITPQESKNRKDPNRFMADLDARLSSPTDTNSTAVQSQSQKPDNGSSSLNQNTSSQLQQKQQQQQQQTDSNLLQSFTKSDNKMNWLRNVASPKIQQSFTNVMKQVPGSDKIGFKKITYEQLNGDVEMNDSNPNGNNTNVNAKRIIKTTNGDNIHVISSSTLALGDAENAELQRLNELMNHSKNSNILTVGLDWIVKNRYYLFILLTFFLTTFGYFYTRKKTDESVT